MAIEFTIAELQKIVPTKQPIDSSPNTHITIFNNGMFGLENVRLIIIQT